MRSPSPKLLEQLADLRLCSPQELAGCERQVVQLCGDLPDFDSVWLDAMVQRRLLTQWQSEQLQTLRGEPLIVGQFSCLQQLGMHSFLAIDRQTRKPVVLRRLQPGHGHAADGGPRAESHAGEGLAQFAAEPGDPSRTAADRLVELISSLSSGNLRADTPTSLVLPRSVLHQASHASANPAQAPAWVVSSYAAGWSLEELLIRGGRFPWRTVAEIGRELLSSLAWLESRRLLHGEIVLRNVRLTTVGQVVLTDAFIRRHLRPCVLLSDQLTLRDCDGVAPEQMSALRSTDVRSELFALGCLLWQCLSARPVVLNADPVARLMKLADQDVADIRVVVPDCPDWMAHSLQAMTRRSPELRPGSAADVLKLWRTSAGSGLAQCRAMARGMPDTARRHCLPVRTRTVAAWPSPAVTSSDSNGQSASRPPRQLHRSASTLRLAGALSAALVLCVAGLVASGVLPRPLRFGRTDDRGPELAINPGGAFDNPTVASAAATSGSQSEVPGALWLWPLPAVDANGSVSLIPGRHYLASGLKRSGLLQIEAVASDHSAISAGQKHRPGAGPPPLLATVHVPEGQNWNLTADQVMLRGIQLQSLSDTDSAKFRQVESAHSGPPASTTNQPELSGSQAGLLTAQSPLLVIEHCWLTTAGRHHDWACVSWTPPPEDTMNDSTAVPQKSEVLLKDVVLQGTGYGLRLAQPPDSLQMDNVLLNAAVSGLRCDVTAVYPRPVRMDVHRVTQRGGTSFVDLVVRSTQVPPAELTITGGESVLAPTTALVRLACPPEWNWPLLQARFQLPRTGNAVIVPPHVKTILRYDAQLQAFVELPETQISSESLLMAEPQFGSDEDSTAISLGSSQAHENMRGFELADFEGPKLTAQMPGIDVTRLPTFQP